MNNSIPTILVQSSDLSRAAALARQIQSLALAGSNECDLEVVEALAEALSYRLSEMSSDLEEAGHGE
jgi:hypothetical protein